MPKKTSKPKKKIIAKKPIKSKVVKKSVNVKAVKKTSKKSPIKSKPVVKAQKPSMPQKNLVLSKSNILVTFDPHHAGSADVEVKDNFKTIGETLSIESESEGLILAKTTDARRAVAKLAALCRKDHTAFMSTHHYLPIDVWCPSDVHSMQEAVKSLLSRIGQNEKWKLHLNKRHYDHMGGVELILKLTEVIDRPNVDLENPTKIVQVEINGDQAAISILTPAEYLDVQRIKSQR